MKYNNATFIPTTNIEQWDINSINANFNLVQWNWSNFENFNSLLAFWTKYEEADSADNADQLRTKLTTTSFAYHEGIIYRGLTDESITLSAGNVLTVKPGSIVYTVNLLAELTEKTRYLVIDSPVKMGYNHTIQNGVLTFTWEILNTWTRPIKGPTGASNWNAKFTFADLKSFNTDGTPLLQFRIPVSSIAAKNPDHPFTYSNAYSIKITQGAEDVEIAVPHKTWIAHEEKSHNHSYIYYLYITFDVTSTAKWKDLFKSSNTFQLTIW